MMARVNSFFIVLMVLFSIENSLSQTIVGLIIDKETKQPLSYVNIGVLEKNLGTVSDTSGYFKLQIKNELGTDTVKFSLIGYESYTIAINDLKEMKDVKIHLKQRTYQLNEVVVNSQKYKYEVLGNQDKNKFRKLGIGKDQLGSELGIAIRVKNSPAYIESAKFYIVSNSYGKIRLRLNIYTFKNDIPSESILDKPIYVETELKHGLWVVDLTEYNLVINNDFFISLEYIQDMGYQGLYFSFGFDNSPSFLRTASQSNWKKIDYKGKSVGASFNVVVSYARK